MVIGYDNLQLLLGAVSQLLAVALLLLSLRLKVRLVLVVNVVLSS